MTIFFKLNNAEFLQHVTQNINKQILILMFYYPNCKQQWKLYCKVLPVFFMLNTLYNITMYSQILLFQSRKDQSLLQTRSDIRVYELTKKCD
jgi:hypothetical protein